MGVDHKDEETEETEEEEEITVFQWLLEQLWKDKKQRQQLWNVGKAVCLFGATVWAMRTFPHFQDPESFDQNLINFMENQQRMALQQ